MKELAPRTRDIEKLSVCLVCPDKASLAKTLARVGSHAVSRLELANAVKASISRSGKFLLIYIYNFHVLRHLLLMYVFKLHWNRSDLIPSGLLESFIVDSLKAHQPTPATPVKDADNMLRLVPCRYLLSKIEDILIF